MPKISFNEKNKMHSIKRSIKKRKKSNLKATVKKMMVMMNPAQDQPSTSTNPNTHNLDDFLLSGRTGRRNAMPDILSDHSLVTSSELPTQLESLTTKDNDFEANNPSTSKQTDNVR